MIDSLVTLLGRFHPLIVHLPIGFLLLGLMMTFYDRKEKKHLGILKFAFLWGALSTLLALITGLVQYDQEGYQWRDIQWHLFFGIVTTGLSFAYYFHLIDFAFFKRIPEKLLAFSLLFVLIFLVFMRIYEYVVSFHRFQAPQALGGCVAAACSSSAPSEKNTPLEFWNMYLV